MEAAYLGPLPGSGALVKPFTWVMAIAIVAAFVVAPDTFPLFLVSGIALCFAVCAALCGIALLMVRADERRERGDDR